MSEVNVLKSVVPSKRGIVGQMKSILGLSMEPDELAGAAISVVSNVISRSFSIVRFVFCDVDYL